MKREEFIALLSANSLSDEVRQLLPDLGVASHAANGLAIAQQRLLNVLGGIQDEIGQHNIFKNIDPEKHLPLTQDSASKLISEFENSDIKLSTLNKTLDILNGVDMDNHLKLRAFGQLAWESNSNNGALQDAIKTAVPSAPDGSLIHGTKSGGADMPGKGTHISADISHEPHAGRGVSKLGLVGTGAVLWGAYTAAEASTGNFSEKAQVFAEHAADAIPGVTYVKKMEVGQYKEAGLDAASYLPSGLLTAIGIVRNQEIQDIIDKLPSDLESLNKMQADLKSPYIDRHLAEAKIMLIEARDAGETGKFQAASSQLTTLAEKKLELQQQWTADAQIFREAAANTHTNWKDLAQQYPNLAAPIATHRASANAGMEPAFLQQIDNKLAYNIEHGVPIQVGITQQAAQTHIHAQQQQEQQAQYAQMAAAPG